MLCAFRAYFFSSTSKNFTGLNATLTAGCVNAGCRIFSMPSNTTANRDNGAISAVGPVYTPDWSYCGPKPGHRYRIRYPNPKDLALSYAYDICSSSGLQFDAGACNATRL